MAAGCFRTIVTGVGDFNSDNTLDFNLELGTFVGTGFAIEGSFKCFTSSSGDNSPNSFIQVADTAEFVVVIGSIESTAMANTSLSMHFDSAGTVGEPGIETSIATPASRGCSSHSQSHGFSGLAERWHFQLGRLLPLLIS